MKPVTLIQPVALMILLASAACGGAEGSGDEALGTAPSAAQANTPGHGDARQPDPAAAPAQPASASTEGTDATPGTLAREIIQAAVRARFPVMRTCYEAALQQAPALAGTVEVSFLIQPDGTVTDAQESSGSTLADPTMVQCVIAAVASASFPAPEGGAVSVVYPIAFSPGE